MSDRQICRNFIMDSALMFQTTQNRGVGPRLHPIFIAKSVFVSFGTWYQQPAVFNSNGVALSKDIRQDSTEAGMQSESKGCHASLPILVKRLPGVLI
jgi:hypothetical protein